MNWHFTGTGNHQGLIIEEGRGRNVAVAYDKRDAPLIAAAPAMLAALQDALEEINDWRRKFHPLDWPEKPIVHSATRNKIVAAIAAATGETEREG